MTARGAGAGVLDRLIQKARMTPAEAAATESLARNLIAKVRALRPHASGVDAFTQEYALSSGEGVMLMCLAEALLRVPDADTQDRLIRDKLADQALARSPGDPPAPIIAATALISKRSRRSCLDSRREGPHVLGPKSFAICSNASSFRLRPTSSGLSPASSS